MSDDHPEPVGGAIGGAIGGAGEDRGVGDEPPTKSAGPLVTALPPRSVLRPEASSNGSAGTNGSARTNGSAAPVAPPSRQVGIRPALVVGGIAVLLLGGFGAAAALTSAPRPTRQPASPQRVHGTPLLAVPAAKALRPIEQDDQPPANILDALTVPSRAARVASKNNAFEDSQYDRQVSFTVPANQLEVIAFFRTELGHLGWTSEGVSAAKGVSGGTEILAQKAGDDSWFWEVGVVVSPTTFAPGSQRGTTTFSLRLIQEPDPD